MKRATMVTLDITHIKKIRDLDLNLSKLINTLLSNYIAESELKDAQELTEWEQNMQENKAKSEPAYDEWYRKRQEEFEEVEKAKMNEKVKRYRKLIDKGMSREDARKEVGLPCQ
jgi:thymidylate synthase ThyX